MPNICTLGLNHLVKLNDIFNFIYMTHDLMLENNNAIVAPRWNVGAERQEKPLGWLLRAPSEGGLFPHLQLDHNTNIVTNIWL